MQIYARKDIPAGWRSHILKLGVDFDQQDIAMVQHRQVSNLAIRPSGGFLVLACSAFWWKSFQPCQPFSGEGEAQKQNGRRPASAIAHLRILSLLSTSPYGQLNPVGGVYGLGVPGFSSAFSLFNAHPAAFAADPAAFAAFVALFAAVVALFAATVALFAAFFASFDRDSAIPASTAAADPAPSPSTPSVVAVVMCTFPPCGGAAGLGTAAASAGSVNVFPSATCSFRPCRSTCSIPSFAVTTTEPSSIATSPSVLYPAAGNTVTSPAFTRTSALVPGWYIDTFPRLSCTVTACASRKNDASVSRPNTIRFPCSSATTATPSRTRRWSPLKTVVFGTSASPLNVASRLPATDPTAADPASNGISPIPITAISVKPSCNACFRLSIFIPLSLFLVLLEST